MPVLATGCQRAEQPDGSAQAAHQCCRVITARMQLLNKLLMCDTKSSTVLALAVLLRTTLCHEYERNSQHQAACGPPDDPVQTSVSSSQRT